MYNETSLAPLDFSLRVYVLEKTFLGFAIIESANKSCRVENEMCNEIV